jgi:hypothetical protein
MKEYTIEQRVETTIGGFFGFIESLSGCQTYRKQEGEQAYKNLLETLREKLVDCYTKNSNRDNDDETIDFNSIKLTMSNPVRLYLMRKNETLH